MALLSCGMTKRTKTAWCVEKLAQFPRFKNPLDLVYEGGDGFPPLTVRLSNFQEVQEFLADQVAHRLFLTETSLDISGRLAPVFDDLVGRLRLRVMFSFPNRYLDRRSIVEFQAGPQILFADEFDL